MTTNAPSFLTDSKLELLIFGGKGGVGKTTSACAAGLAIASARPGSKVLLLSTDPAHSVADCLGEEAVPSNLSVVELSAEAEHKAFMDAHAGHLHDIASRGTFLDSKDIDGFVKLSIPGLDELMAFLKVARWVQEKAYATIVVDSAPSGHTLRLLSMTDLLENWLEAIDSLLAKHRYMAGLFRGRSKPKADGTEEFLSELGEQLAGLKELFTAKDRCRFVPVMLAEPLSVDETLDVVARLDEMGVAAPEVIVNRLVGEEAGPGFAAQRTMQARVLGDWPPALKAKRVFGSMLSGDEMTGAGRLAKFVQNLRVLESGWAALATPAPEADLTPSPSCRGQGVLPVGAKQTQLMFFAGKGGVGKTTMAAMTAVRLAEQGRRTLLVSTDPAHSLGDCVGVKLADEAASLRENLDALEIDAPKEFEQLRDQYRDELGRVLDKMFANVDLSFDREAMDKLMDLAPPGLDECMALLRIIDKLDGPAGDHYDVIVIDTAPTGHMLRLLELPELISAWLNQLFAMFLKYDNIFRLPKLQVKLVGISRGIKKLRGTLTDGKRCQVQVVSILTEMALAECGDLVGSLDRMQVRVGNLFLNMALGPDSSELGKAVRAREALVLARYDARFGTHNRVVVERSGDPRGINNLSALAGRVYDGQAKEWRAAS